MSLLTKPESERFQFLQTKQDNQQALSDTEQREFQDIEDRLLTREAAYLRSANERLLLDAERVNAENEGLRRIIARKQEVASRLRGALADALAEEKLIQRELLPRL